MSNSQWNADQAVGERALRACRTTKQPTEPGWYFGYYSPYKAIRFIEVVYNFPEQTKPAFWVADLGYVPNTEIAWWWSEKIDFPLIERELKNDKKV